MDVSKVQKSKAKKTQREKTPQSNTMRICRSVCSYANLRVRMYVCIISLVYICKVLMYQASGGNAGNGFRAMLKLCVRSRLGLSGAWGEVGDVAISASASLPADGSDGWICVCV